MPSARNRFATVGPTPGQRVGAGAETRGIAEPARSLEAVLVHTCETRVPGHGQHPLTSIGPWTGGYGVVP